MPQGQFSAADVQAPPPSGKFSSADIDKSNSSGDYAKAVAQGFFGALDPRNLAQLVHPIDLVSNIWKMGEPQRQEAKKLWDQGEYAKALERGIPGYVPLIGPLGDTVENDPDPVKSANALGQLLALKAGPKLAEAAVDAAPVAGAALKAGVKAGGSDVAVGAAKIAGGAVLDEAGVPYHVGAAMGATQGVPQIIRGVVKGVKAGYQAGKEAANPPPPEVVSTPLPESRQIAAPTAIITPPPSDTSGVIPGWKPTVLENETSPASATPAKAGPTLDEIAIPNWGKPFTQLSEKDQAIVQKIAKGVSGQPESTSPAPAAGPVERIDTGPESPKGKTIQDLLEEELASRRAQVAPSEPIKPAPVESKSPPSAWLPPEELDNAKTTGLPVEKHMANRAAMAQRFVEKIGGTQNLPTNQSEWARLADDLGERVPSKETQAQIEFGLNRRMVTKTETAGSEASTPSAVARNPKALKIAQKLQAEMESSGTTTKEVPSMPVSVKGTAADIKSVGPTVPGIGATVTLKNGKTVIVKELHPDGTFDYE